MSSVNSCVLSPFIASVDGHALPEGDSFHPEQISKADELKCSSLHELCWHTVTYCRNKHLTVMQLQVKCGSCSSCAVII